MSKQGKRRAGPQHAPLSRTPSPDVRPDWSTRPRTASRDASHVAGPDPSDWPKATIRDGATPRATSHRKTASTSAYLSRAPGIHAGETGATPAKGDALASDGRCPSAAGP